MSIIKIDGKEFRAVLTACAKDDTRYYLNGWCLDAAGSEIVATNGHVLYRAPIEIDEPHGVVEEVHTCLWDEENGQIVYAIDGPAVPAGTLEVVVDTAKDELTALTAKGSTCRKLLRIDCKYPDYRAVVPDAGRDLGLDSEVSFNPEYLAPASKALSAGRGKKSEPVHPVLAIADAISPIAVRFHGTGVTGVLMPCRVAGAEPKHRFVEDSEAA